MTIKEIQFHIHCTETIEIVSDKCEHLFEGNRNGIPESLMDREINFVCSALRYIDHDDRQLRVVLEIFVK